jgi:hypothetical protein
MQSGKTISSEGEALGGCRLSRTGVRVEAALARYHSMTRTIEYPGVDILQIEERTWNSPGSWDEARALGFYYK